MPAPVSAAAVLQAMGTMNNRMNIPALAKIMKEFERQNAKMDQVEEMMGDAMDDVFEVPLPCASGSFDLGAAISASLHYICHGQCMPSNATLHRGGLFDLMAGDAFSASVWLILPLSLVSCSRLSVLFCSSPLLSSVTSLWGALPLCHDDCCHRSNAHDAQRCRDRVAGTAQVRSCALAPAHDRLVSI